MKRDDGFIDFLRELLEPLGAVTVRRMFGGHGVYVDSLFIAIVIDGRLYLKVDELTRADFQALGSAPFVYQSGDKTVEMSYWNAPEEALDSPQQMRPWAQRAIAAALRKPAVKGGRSPRSASKSR
jgi:DNA transformation protein